jgi:hypothetical protein
MYDGRGIVGLRKSRILFRREMYHGGLKERNEESKVYAMVLAGMEDDRAQFLDKIPLRFSLVGISNRICFARALTKPVRLSHREAHLR